MVGYDSRQSMIDVGLRNGIRAGGGTGTGTFYLLSSALDQDADGTVARRNYAGDYLGTGILYLLFFSTFSNAGSLMGWRL